MKIGRVNENGNISFKGPRGPGRPMVPAFRGHWSPGMGMYVLSGGVKACVPPAPGEEKPIRSGLNYFA